MRALCHRAKQSDRRVAFEFFDVEKLLLPKASHHEQERVGYPGLKMVLRQMVPTDRSQQLCCAQLGCPLRRPTPLIFESRHRESSIFGIETAVSLPQKHGKQWGRSPPLCPVCFWDGRFDPKVDDFRGRLLKVRSMGPLGRKMVLRRMVPKDTSQELTVLVSKLLPAASGKPIRKCGGARVPD